MVRKSDAARRGRRKKVKRESLCPWLSVFLPCLVSYLPLLVSRGVLVQFSLPGLCECAPLWPCVLFLWVCFCRDCGPPGRKGPGCRCELGRQQGTERHIVLGVLGELGLQSDPVSCHHRTTLSTVTAWPPKTHTHTHTAPLPEPLSFFLSLPSLLSSLYLFLIPSIPVQIYKSMEKYGKNVMSLRS